MNTTKAIILGLIQGLTEFLPVSSSGHLVLGQHLMGLREPELLFDVLMHLATLTAIVIVLRREILALLVQIFRLPRHLKNRDSLTAAWRDQPSFRLLALIVIGSVPTGLIGIGLKDVFESLFGSPLAVGWALLATGVVLFLTRLAPPRGRTVENFKIVDALIVGLAQGLAITPGLSRSGLTISTGLFLGLDRETAARYSFLLFIPAVIGALGLELVAAEPGSFSPVHMAAGFIAALISGLAALVFLLRIVRRGRLHYFAYYCWALGLITLVLTAGVK